MGRIVNVPVGVSVAVSVLVSCFMGDVAVNSSVDEEEELGGVSTGTLAVHSSDEVPGRFVTVPMSVDVDVDEEMAVTSTLVIKS
ncbi:hypothetical protein BDW69DRAFT_158488 [Aspergillus filifer]